MEASLSTSFRTSKVLQDDIELSCATCIRPRRYRLSILVRLVFARESTQA